MRTGGSTGIGGLQDLIGLMRAGGPGMGMNFGGFGGSQVPPPFGSLFSDVSGGGGRVNADVAPFTPGQQMGGQAFTPGLVGMGAVLGGQYAQGQKQDPWSAWGMPWASARQGNLAGR